MSFKVTIEEYIDNNYDNFCFDSLSIGKFVFLAVITFGVYVCIWFYNIWKQLTIKSNAQISPICRTIFLGIFIFLLFPILNKYFSKLDICCSFTPVLFAILYIILSLLANLPGPYWLLGFTSIIIPVLIQSKINYINTNYFPESSINKWNFTNTVWTIPFLILFTLAIIRTFS